MMELYCIVATPRPNKKRVMITGQMSFETACNWKPSAWYKKLFKYFRVAKYPYY